MPLIPKKASLLQPKSKSVLSPRLTEEQKTIQPEVKKSRLIPKPQPEIIIPSKPIVLPPERNKEKVFNKWFKQLEDGALECAVLKSGRTSLRIIFNPEIEHFMLQYVDKDNSTTNFKTTFSVDMMSLVRTALRRVEKVGLIINGRAMAPPPDEEGVLSAK